MTRSKAQFEFTEHTADIGIRVEAATLDELFEQAALALTDLIVAEIDSREEKTQLISLRSPTVEGLLYEWLSEFVYLFDAEQSICSGFEKTTVHAADGSWSIESQAKLRRFDASVDRVKTYAKAVTYYQLAVVQEHGRFRAQVIIDI